ncbi:hypothetical protein [Hymenobacter koreensis]|uniref:Uncharacterized protein n=1 Tax=Hymenobacter koreensis TaxID=1084523 RepID=A0ABP8JNM6_9BACT
MNVLVELTPKEYRKLLRQRGRLWLRQADHRPATPLFVYWHQWECIQDERRYLNTQCWRSRNTRYAYRNRLKHMRYLRLNSPTLCHAAEAAGILPQS